MKTPTLCRQEGVPNTLTQLFSKGRSPLVEHPPGEPSAPIRDCVPLSTAVVMGTGT